MPLAIRIISRLTADEIEQLIDLLTAVVDDGASVGFLPPLGRAAAEQYWRSVLAPGIVLLVAELDGHLVGTVQLHLATRPNATHRAEVAKLMVHPAYQRRGYGQRLMQAIEALARQEHRSLLMLDTRESDPSNALYRSMGYLSCGRIPHYARSASGQLDATVFYYKELG